MTDADIEPGDPRLGELGLAELDEANWSVLQRVARSVHSPTATFQDTLDSIVASAVDLVEGAVWAGLILLEKGRLTPVAVLGEPPMRLDELQARTGEGPCVEAAYEQRVVSIDDMSTEVRWSEFVGTALELSVHSLLCVPLEAKDGRRGSLSLYAASADAFDKQDLAVGQLFATHAGLVLDDAIRVVQLTEAISSRDVIGQAKGILMERHRLTPDAAFALLRKSSQVTNTKLSEVALRLTESGELPGAL